MITHLDSSDLQELIRVHRLKRDLFKPGQLGFVLELHRVDTLQNLHKSLFGEFFEPKFFTFINHGLETVVGDVNESSNSSGSDFVG